MSPASQGPLEVERYIGSCLISSNARVNSGSSVGGGKGGNTNGNAPQHHHQHQKAKKSISEGDRYRQSYGGGVVPLCECGGGSGGGARYGRNWAGMPLISMAGSGARRSRKPSPRDGKGEVSEGQPRTPLSRLAIHTQGAPLILAGRYCSTRKSTAATGGQGGARTPAPRPFRGGEVPTRRPGPVVPRSVPTGSSASTTPSSDCLSVASDESSGHSENSLPRIIKPRKRRKKDRKPPPPAVEPEVKTGESSSIVTLKPYVPLCYDRYERRRPWDAEARTEDEERASHSSDEDLHGPQLQHELEDLEEEASQGAPASLCQCRYCDPAGLIWDVRQHCYSPFLTPPGPFASIPLFLGPPAEFTSAIFMPEDDRTALRRSWSEPSAWSGTTRHASTSSETSSASVASSSGSSQSLEVSTEIVTSPNGHRDIEIKFYSSSPPAAQDNASESVRAWNSSVWEDRDGIWGRGASNPDQSTKTLGEEVNQLRLQVEE